MTVRGARFVLLLLLGAPQASCSAGSAAAPATLVFAASSLAEPFAEIAAAFERRHPGKRIELHCAGTPQLLFQIAQGAPADVLASADEPNMAKAVAKGYTAAPPRVFARNRLVIAVGRGNPAQVRSLADLARVDLDVALCAPEVPAGRYARQALARAGVALEPVSAETSVKALVGKVRLGEVDAAVVYETDASAGLVEAVAIPDAHQVEVAYPIAVLAKGRDRTGAEDFVGFVLGSEGRAILQRCGFLLP